MPLFFLIVCICMFISSSCIYAGDICNVTSDSDFNIDLYNDIDVIDADFNQMDDPQISLENSSDESIENNTFVVNTQLLSYSAGYYGSPAEYGGFVSIDDCLINADDAANTHELIGCCQITDDNVKIQNLTFTNSLPGNAGVSNGCLCSNVMSPICFGDNGYIPLCAFSCDASTGAICLSGNDVFLHQPIFEKLSAFSAVGKIYVNGANYTICNNLSVYNSSELSEESIHYGRNRKNVNAAPSFGDAFMCFNRYAQESYMNHYNLSDSIGGVPLSYIISQSVLDSKVNAGYCMADNEFALTENSTLDDFEISLTKDVFSGIYTFLFNEDDSNAFSLVKNTYHCNMHCEVFGINPVYSLEYEGNTANKFTCYYNDKFLNSIFSKSDLTDCSSQRDLHKSFILSTLFKKSHTLCFNSVGDFSFIEDFAILCGDERAIAGKGVMFSSCRFSGDFSADIYTSASLLDALLLDNLGMNYSIKTILSVAIIDWGHCCEL